MKRYGSLTSPYGLYLTVSEGNDKYVTLGMFNNDDASVELVERIVAFLNLDSTEAAVAELRSQLEQGGES